VFKYNAAFSNPLFRIKINNIQLKETAEENAKTNAEVGMCRCSEKQWAGWVSIKFTCKPASCANSKLWGVTVMYVQGTVFALNVRHALGPAASCVCTKL